jgi:(p)ppGpp synthase/HD superfamily hydrolase
MDRPAALSPALDRALAMAATWHAGQVRKGTGVPYIQHAMAVALLLDRFGFDDLVVAAALLHDAAEDTDATLDDIRCRFGEPVGALVSHCTERKHDQDGRKRPWRDRKEEQLALIERLPLEACAILLADKWHNLFSTRLDIAAGEPAWERFNAPRDEWLAMNRRFVDAVDRREFANPALARLVELCQAELVWLETLPG